MNEAFQAEGVVDIMNVTLVPFGNARYVGDKLQCQHGPDECAANSYEQCAIDAPVIQGALPVLPLHGEVRREDALARQGLRRRERASTSR